MTVVFTEREVLTRIGSLTPSRLTAFLELRAVIPLRRGEEAVFRPADLARLGLLCEFGDLYDLEPEALSLLIAVIDSLHAARRDRDDLRAAIEEEPPEVRSRIASAVLLGRTRDAARPPMTGQNDE